MSVRRSLKRRVAAGDEREFSTREDFVAQLIEDGRIRDERELEAKPGLYTEIFDRWLEQRQVGCIFAVRMAAGHIKTTSWSHFVIQEPSTDVIHATTKGVLLAPGVPDAVSFIFPSLTTVDDVVTLIGILCEDPDGRWGWEDIAPERKDVALVGLRWKLADGQSASWVLGFASFDPMPITRHAPFVAIVMRTRPSGRGVGEGQLDGVHLADLLSHFGERAETTWHATCDLRRGLVNKDDRTAKAKTTFTLPRSVIAKLPAPTTYAWASQDKPFICKTDR